MFYKISGKLSRLSWDYRTVWVWASKAQENCHFQWKSNLSYRGAQNKIWARLNETKCYSAVNVSYKTEMSTHWSFIDTCVLKCCIIQKTVVELMSHWQFEGTKYLSQYPFFQILHLTKYLKLYISVNIHFLIKKTISRNYLWICTGKMIFLSLTIECMTSLMR